MKLWRELLLAMLMIIPLMSCSSAAEKSEMKPAATRKGEQRAMKTYYMGRFAIDVPADFILEVQSQKFRYAEVEEIEWPVDMPREKAKAKVWDARMAEIHELKPPEGVSKVIVKFKDVKNTGLGGKGILYYNNYMSTVDGCWEVLVDTGPVGLWVKLVGLIEYEEDMLTDIKEMANSYRYYSGVGLSSSVIRGFFLRKGVFLLPYFEQEQTYARFKGPMDMVLKVEMREIHKSPGKEGIVDRTAAAIATGFAAGLDVKIIRSRQKTVAGLPGEEEIVQGDDGRHKNVSFDWEYLGRVESGEQPMIQISIDTKADNLDKKVSVWDQVLESFRTVP